MNLEIDGKNYGPNMREHLIMLKDIIKELATKDPKGARVEDVIELAKEKGMPPSGIDACLQRWREDGEIYTPRIGRIKIVDLHRPSPAGNTTLDDFGRGR